MVSHCVAREQARCSKWRNPEGETRGQGEIEIYNFIVIRERDAPTTLLLISHC
jgi:hypothetical protein